MGKKKKGKGKGPKLGSRAKIPLKDPRALEKTLADIGRLLDEQQFDSLEEANAFLEDIMSSGEVPSLSRELTPLEQAQELMYKAFDSYGKQRVKLARQALRISEDCADAYVLLAEETARSLEEAKYLYEQGVKAGERALGFQRFKEDVGDFWGILETRPYMRARAGLARCLWQSGEGQQAIEHYSDMLRLNPNDNQGIRYLLASCLLEEGLDRELGKLLKQYKDDGSADWCYTQALWMFRQGGATPKANKLLKEALNYNPFVPLYLLGRKKIPNRLPDYVGFGDKNEAVAYVAEAIEAWRRTPGALEWLANNLLQEVE